MIKYQTLLLINEFREGNAHQRLRLTLQNGKYYDGIISSTEADEELIFKDDRLKHIHLPYKEIINIETIDK